MIALNETDPTAAEVAFFLPLTSDPFTGPGLTGHDFSGNAISGEVRLKLPGGAWFNADGAQIVEKGEGRYVVQLTAGQCATAGVVYVKVSVSGAQPYSGDDQIGTGGGDYAVGDTAARVPFYLADATDPVFGTPITGHVFAPGEVLVATPGTGYVDADVANVVEVGNGLYELLLTSGQVADRGKVFVYAAVSGAQRWEGFATILTALITTTPAVITPVTATVASPVTGAGFVDHVQAAVSRLAQEFRS